VGPAGAADPWVLFDLERIAWVVEQRRDELTPGERAVLRAVAARLAQAADASEG
jgi:hypothetical protein